MGARRLFVALIRPGSPPCSATPGTGFVNTQNGATQYLIVPNDSGYSAIIGPAMTLATLIVTALATVALAFVGIVQIRTNRAENKRRNGRLDAAANYYAMLVGRSLLETVRTLNQDLSKDDLTWRNEMNRMSAALGKVKKDVEEMLKAAIERHGGSSAELEAILTLFYAGTDTINALAKEDFHATPNTKVQRLAKARNKFDECCRKLGNEFALQKYQPVDPPEG